MKEFPKKNKIITVGRVTDFKTYIFDMVAVCHDLKNNKNIDLEFHIYGDGELFKKLGLYIKKLNASAYIFPHGAIQYSQMESVLKDAFLFIGSGTSLIESSAASVPSLMSIECNQSKETYGFFFETEGYDLAEINDTMKKYSMESKILEIINLNKDEYKKYSALCQKRSEDFSMRVLMQKFLNSLEESKDFKFKISIFEIFWVATTFFFWKSIEKIGLKSAFSERYSENININF